MEWTFPYRTFPHYYTIYTTRTLYTTRVNAKIMLQPKSTFK